MQNSNQGRLKFSVIGLNHGHIYGLTRIVQRGGGELVSFYAKEPDLVAAFAKAFPAAKLARSQQEILEDRSIHLIVSAAIPNERAALGLAALRHGKDFLVDKPGLTSLEQLAQVRRAHEQTHRLYSIMYGRLESQSVLKAGELVKAGAIGRVLQTLSLGPHRLNAPQRPAWFFKREQYGGIICDIGTHQVDQFLYFTGSTSGEVVASQVGNLNHPQYPELEDFGEAMMRGNRGTGYLRVDWFTPAGLPTWGDTRLKVLGTEGYLEIRHNIDLAGRTGSNHLFLVDQKGVHYIDTGKVPQPYGEQLVNDILNRTETAMPQEYCFLVTELTLKAQQQAQRLKFKA